MNIFKYKNDRLECIKIDDATASGFDEILDDAIWIDLLNPSKIEIETVNTRFHMALPRLEYLDTKQILPRFEALNSCHIFSAKFLMRRKDVVETVPVWFALSENILITLRRDAPHVFDEFYAVFDQDSAPKIPDTQTLFFELMLILALNYSSDLEAMGEVLNHVAHQVLTEDLKGRNDELHKKQVNEIARTENLNGKMMNSLMGLSLVADYFHTLKEGHHKFLAARFEANIENLTEQGTFISDRIDFVLNAVISVINLEQNRVINIFSVFTVIFTLPTLLAGIWGMNFVFMPELHWHWGYFVALGGIVLSGIIPYLVVRKMGWL